MKRILSIVAYIVMTAVLVFTCPCQAKIGNNSGNKGTELAIVGSIIVGGSLIGLLAAVLSNRGGNSDTPVNPDPQDSLAPSIISISPSTGLLEGRTHIVIKGTNFNGATAVKFGKHNAIFFETINSKLIKAISPAGDAGAVDIRVITPNGADTLKHAFTYQAPPSPQDPPAPTITSISPSEGPLEGGTPIIIKGTGFDGATEVSFGDSRTTRDFKVNSSTQITIIALPGDMAETVDIRVTTPNGTSKISARDRFTYQTVIEAPVITSVLTANVNSGAPFSYRITATNSPTSFNVASLPGGLSIDVVTGIISGTTSAIGTTNITISATNAGGTDSKTLVLTINPAPTINSISPIAGFLHGNTPVTITGTGFTDTTSVKFGTIEVGSFSVVSDTKITTSSSPATTYTSSAAVPVVVTTPYGTSNSVTFTYQPAPILSDYVYDGNTLIVGGSNFSELGNNYITATIDNTSVEVTFISNTQLNVSIELNPNNRIIKVTNGDGQYISEKISTF